MHRRSFHAVRTPVRRLSTVAVVALVAALSLSLAAPDASAAFLGKARKMSSPAVIVASVVKRSNASETDIWSFQYGTDGSVTPLTNYSPEGRPYNEDPTFSPEGGPHIVYVGKSGPSAHDGDLYVVDRDTPGTRGVDPQNITQTRLLDGDAEHPAWAPSGGKIAFDFTPSGADDAQLWWTSLSGAVQQPITCCDSPDGGLAGRLRGDVVKGTDPAWSPNSNWIAYTKHVSAPVGPDVLQLWVTSFSGKRPLDALPDGPVQVPLGLGEQPNWSPLGDRIAFVNQGSLYVIRFSPLSFRNQTPLLVDTPPAGMVDESPAWSPDSYDTDTVCSLFDRRRPPTPSTDSKQIYTVDPNARGRRRTRSTRGTRRCSRATPTGGRSARTTSRVVRQDHRRNPGPDLLCGGDGQTTFKAMGGDDRIFAGAGPRQDPGRGRGRLHPGRRRGQRGHDQRRGRRRPHRGLAGRTTTSTTPARRAARRHPRRGGNDVIVRERRGQGERPRGRRRRERHLHGRQPAAGRRPRGRLRVRLRGRDRREALEVGRPARTVPAPG